MKRTVIIKKTFKSTAQLKAFILFIEGRFQLDETNNMNQLVSSILTGPFNDLYPQIENSNVRKLLLQSNFWKLYKPRNDAQKIERRLTYAFTHSDLKHHMWYMILRAFRQKVYPSSILQILLVRKSVPSLIRRCIQHLVTNANLAGMYLALSTEDRRTLDYPEYSSSGFAEKAQIRHRISISVRDQLLKRASKYIGWPIYNLKYANMEWARLDQLILHDIDLTGVNLKNADLNYIEMHNVNMEGANLQGATLSNVNLTKVILTNANLQGAKIERSTIEYSDFTCANLQLIMTGYSYIRNTSFDDADLRGAELRGAGNLSSNSFTGAKIDQATEPHSVISRLI